MKNLVPLPKSVPQIDLAAKKWSYFANFGPPIKCLNRQIQLPCRGILQCLDDCMDISTI